MPISEEWYSPTLWPTTSRIPRTHVSPVIAVIAIKRRWMEWLKQDNTIVEGEIKTHFRLKAKAIRQQIEQYVHVQ